MRRLISIVQFVPFAAATVLVEFLISIALPGLCMSSNVKEPASVCNFEPLTAAAISLSLVARPAN